MPNPDSLDITGFDDPWDSSDPLDDGANDGPVDAELDGYVRRAADLSRSGGESVTALSALAQRMSTYRPLSIEEQEDRLSEYNAGLAATARIASGKAGRHEAKLQAAVRRGEQAQMELVGSMFRLVMIIARELATDRYGRDRSLSLLEDLVADALAEIVEAIPRYDARRCPTFAIYAGRVARDRIRSSLSKSDPLKVPSAWLRLKRVSSTLVPELAASLGRKPTTAEIQEALLERCMEWAAGHLTAEQLTLPRDEQQALMRAKLVKQGMIGAIERYEEVMAATQSAASLDAPLAADGTGTYADLLTDSTHDSVFDAVELGQLSQDLAQALGTLGERERDIILHRFGLVDGESWTYARLAPRYGISAERVRQIEASVLARLRGPSFGHLASYLPSTQE